jgi:hypothetical protein
MADSSDGSMPNQALINMTWTVLNAMEQNHINDAFVYGKKYNYGWWDIIGYFAGGADSGGTRIPASTVQNFSEQQKRYWLAYAYNKYVEWGWDAFANVQNIVNEVTNQKNTIGIAADPTHGSIMYNHADYRANRYWAPTGKFQSAAELAVALEVNFSSYAAGHPNFVYSIWVYPPDDPRWWPKVLVTGNDVCIETSNWCGAP